MKICVALHSCMDLGGIINHTEQLIGGLKELGHRVDLKELVYSDRANTMGKGGDFEVANSGILFHQGKGWNFKAENRLAYKTTAGLSTARQILNGYDMVIWTVPVPPKNKNHAGNSRWPDLYDLKPHVKQIAFIHDGNVKAGAPHLLHVQDKLSGLACVHACAFNGANHLTVPRAMVLNPQFMPIRDVLPWENKRAGFVNMQTFKAWKRVHELVEAIAYMPSSHPEELREIAGKGIEYQYMTSEEKCKDNYYHTDSDSWFAGMKFWEAAELNGMNHHDYWNNEEVISHLASARVLVDPSWSAKYSQVGGHWNRVVVDAMIHGCVPVAQSRGMGNELFIAGQHYIDLGIASGDPEHYAEIILEAGNINATKAMIYRDEARQLLPMFNRVAVAQRLVDLANGNIDTSTGVDDPNIRNKYENLMFNQYGVLV